MKKSGIRAKEIILALRAVCSEKIHIHNLHEPLFEGSEWHYVKKCIDTGWVSTGGSFVDRFEEMLREITGAKEAIATVNGTSGLHLGLRLAGVSPGDEVLVPALSFVATANAVSYCGAVPHFVDSSGRTLGVDPERLSLHLERIADLRDGHCVNRSTGKTIRALVVVHAFGHPADLDPLVELCARFRLAMVEDAAESLGTLYKGKHTGTLGQLGILSFNGNKVVTTGGGGAVLTNDVGLGKLARHLSTTAKRPHPWKYDHDMVGFNYRLPNINAALGCAQLENLPLLVSRKRSLANAYEVAFQGVEGVSIFREPSFATSNYWLNTLLLDSASAETLEEILVNCHAEGLLIRPAWTLLPRLAMYEGCPSMELSVAKDLSARILNLPSSPSLGKALYDA